MKSTKYILLSYCIDESTPVYGNTPQPQILQNSSISSGDTSNTFNLKIHNHTGTHIDAPYHFQNNGNKISDYSLEDLIFSSPVVLGCTVGKEGNISSDSLMLSADRLEGADCLLLRTNFGIFRNEDVYRTHNPAILSEAIKWLRKEFPSIRCLGIDTISISSYQNRDEGRKAHNEAFILKEGSGEPLLLIEDMNLESLKDSHILKKIIVIPWQIKGIDSAPCSILAEIEQKE